MPTIIYSEEEYLALEKINRDLVRQLEAIHILEPVRNISAHVTAVALASIWKELGVTNQTGCMAKIEKLKEKFDE